MSRTIADVLSEAKSALYQASATYEYSAEWLWSEEQDQRHMRLFEDSIDNLALLYGFLQERNLLAVYLETSPIPTMEGQQ